MKKVVNREMVEAYNRIAETFRGSNDFHKFLCSNEWLNGTKWVLSGYYLIRSSYLPREDETFYIKKIGEYTYLYYENRNEKERFCLSDVAIAYFVGKEV